MLGGAAARAGAVLAWTTPVPARCLVYRVFITHSIAPAPAMPPP
jgi:hypothetical protein